MLESLGTSSTCLLPSAGPAPNHPCSLLCPIQTMSLAFCSARRNQRFQDPLIRNIAQLIKGSLIRLRDYSKIEGYRSLWTLLAVTVDLLLRSALAGPCKPSTAEPETPISLNSRNQRLQYPLIEEAALNHMGSCQN